MRFKLAALPALLIAGTAVANGDGQRDATDPKAKARGVEYRSAFEGYRPYADQELRDWRKSNADVRDAGGHAGHQRGQGPGQPAPKPRPGSPESSGRHGEHRP
jgi:hypothetical protein